MALISRPTRSAGRRSLERAHKAYGRIQVVDPIRHLRWVMSTGADDGRPNTRSGRDRLFFTPVTQSSAGPSATNWETYRIPRSATIVHMVALGGGGAGGGGGSSTTASTSGGGGGGSGAAAVLTIPARFLPSVLFILTGLGGTGAQGLAGGTGGRTFVCADESIAAATAGATILVSGAAEAMSGGAGGTTTSTAGAASTVSTQQLGAWGCLGIMSPLAGQAGTTCAAAGTGGAVAYGGSIGWTSGGAAGGGGSTTVAHPGGAITGAGIWIATLAGGVAATSGTGNPGKQGYMLSRFPTLGTGGSGGGSVVNTAAAAVTGGLGGNGGWGGGGGGGGSAFTTGTATKSFGGNGGPGFLYIWWE